MIEILSRAHAKGKKVLNDLKLGTCIGRFPSGGAASMAVKRLISAWQRLEELKSQAEEEEEKQQQQEQQKTKPTKKQNKKR